MTLFLFIILEITSHFLYNKRFAGCALVRLVLCGRFAEKGLEILDFPCNQFGEQTPGSDEEIHSFCTGRYGITFPQFAKIDVNGENAISLYQWLVENSTFEVFDRNPMGMMINQMLKKTGKDFKNSNTVKWNFTKFLIGKDGQVVARFEPTASMKKVKSKIEEIL